MSLSSPARAHEQQVVAAARAWRGAYLAWLHDDTKYDATGGCVRDLSANGENLALSKLLDALQALEAVEQRTQGITAR